MVAKHEAISGCTKLCICGLISCYPAVYGNYDVSGWRCLAAVFMGNFWTLSHSSDAASGAIASASIAKNSFRMTNETDIYTDQGRSSCQFSHTCGLPQAVSACGFHGDMEGGSYHGNSARDDAISMEIPRRDELDDCLMAPHAVSIWRQISVKCHAHALRRSSTERIARAQ